MSVEEDTELRDLVSKTLENNGVLAKIRAELRASVFLALEEQESKTTPFENKALKEYLKSPQAALGLCIVREFLEYLELDFSLSVYNTETSHGKGYEYSGRSKLIKDLQIKSLNGKKGPILSHILQIAQESNEIAQDKEDSPKLGPVISKLPSESGSFNLSHEGTCVESPNASLAPLDRTFTSDGPTMKVLMSSSVNDDDSNKCLSVKPESILPQSNDDKNVSANISKSVNAGSNKSTDASISDRKSNQDKESKLSKPVSKTSMTSLNDLPPLDSHQGRGNMASNINFAGLGLQDEYEEDFVSTSSSAALEEKNKSLSHKSNTKHGPTLLDRVSLKSDVENSDKKSNSPGGSISEDLDDNTNSGLEDLLNSTASTENTADNTISQIKSAYADYLEKI